MSSDGRFLERGGAIDQDHAEPLGVHPPPAAAATYIKRIYKQLEPKDGPCQCDGKKHIPPEATDIYTCLRIQTEMTDNKALLSIENPSSFASS
jgi:hypothetical protein